MIPSFRCFPAALILAAADIVTGCSMPTQRTPNVAEFTAPTYRPGVVHHIVLFRYKRDVGLEQRAAILQRFQALKLTALRDGRPYILAIHAGTQNSHEGLGQGFDQAFIVEFGSEGDRNYYVGTPAVTDPAFYDPVHHAFKKDVGPLLADEGALVFDFASNQIPTGAAK